MVAKKEERAFDKDFSLFEEVGDLLGSQDEGSIVDANQQRQRVVDPNINEDSEFDEQDGVNDEDEDLINSFTQNDEDEDNANEGNDNDEGNIVEDEIESSSLFTPYAKMLVDEGVFSNLEIDKFDGTADGLKKAMSNEIDFYVNQYKSQMPAEIQRLLNGYEAGVPFDEMLKITSDAIRYSNIKDETLLENTTLQKSIVKDYLDKTTKLPELMKTKMISQWEDSLELGEQSKVALEELKSFQREQESEAIKAQQLQQENYKEQQTQALNNLNKHILGLNEIVPGIKVNDVLKKRIKDNLTIPIGRDSNGTPINKFTKYMIDNPIEGEVTLNYLYEVTGGFKDFSVFKKSGSTQALKDLEKAARMADTSLSGDVKSTRTRANHKDLNAAISGFLNG